VIRKGSMRSVTVNCSALTPESHSQPTAEPRPASTGSKWFVKAERSSCGTARLCPAAMPESNCRRCRQDSNVLIDEASPKHEYPSGVPSSIDTVLCML
jgi:hypothetical protein